MADDPSSEGVVEPAGEADVGVGAAPDESGEGPPSRSRVLDAAARVFAAEGLDAPMPSIAAAAGVGVGTIYRAFGSKDELIAALAADRVDRFCRDTLEALEAPDAWRALCELFMLTAEHQAEDRVVTEALGVVSEHSDVIESQARAGEAITALMDRAKEQGGLRSDFEPQDLQMFFAALGAAQHTVPAGSRAWKRLVGLLVDGLRAEGATALVEPPLTSEDIARAMQERRERRR